MDAIGDFLLALVAASLVAIQVIFSLHWFWLVGIAASMIVVALCVWVYRKEKERKRKAKIRRERGIKIAPIHTARRTRS